MEQDGRTLLDPIVIGPLGIMALIEWLDEGDSDFLDNWLKKPGPERIEGAPSRAAGSAEGEQ
ncbi:hypothetical protein LCGC14_2543910 [marine sediment metagenome]|uniref:Uncharacterized protein n=1 Tax=marine sediment metagenome TaxID=412755 RepID=A0A0F9APV5_9ZZZZ